MAIDIDTLKTLGSILGAILGVVSTIIPLFFKPGKSRLRTDLEILNLIKQSNPNYEDDPKYQKVKNVVDETFENIYIVQEQDTLRRIIWGVVGLGLLFGFGYWTYELVTPKFSWWSLLTGYISLCGAVYLIAAMAGIKASKKITKNLFRTFVRS